MKLRVANWYESRLGRNDGNPLYVTNVLKRDYADHIEFHHMVPDPALQFAMLGRFDLNFWIDWGEDALQALGMLPYHPIPCPHPSVYWTSDTHLGYEYRLRKAREFDHVFCAQHRAVEDFARQGVAAQWLPHAVEPQAYNPAGTFAATPEKVREAAQVYRLKKWDVVFVGHLNSPDRIDRLDQLFRGVPNYWFASRRTGRTFERAADLYTQARVVWNDAIRDDVNMRVFEVLATRSFLLTQWVPTLSQLFEDGVHLATWREMDEAIEKARYYAAHDDEREAIAEAGYREVLAKHTVAHRVARMLDVAGILPVNP